MTLLEDYSHRYDHYLVPISLRLESFFRDRVVGGMPRVDRVSARAKDPARFVAKAEKKWNNSDTQKYANPLTEIQDQIGVRIVVFYASDVHVVLEKVLEYFKPIEQKSLEPAGHDEFGYFGKHLVAPVPNDVINTAEESLGPQLFELQIKTLFQHAWAECSHDVAYKEMRGSLDADLRRKIAYAAAQAWGADKIFEELMIALAEPTHAIID